MHTRPFWLSQGKAFHGRTKQEGEKEKTGKGKKNNRKRKEQEQEGEAREGESFFWWQDLFTKTHKNQHIWHAASTVTKKATVNMLKVLWHRPCNKANRIFSYTEENKDLCVHVLHRPHSHWASPCKQMTSMCSCSITTKERCKLQCVNTCHVAADA